MLRLLGSSYHNYCRILWRLGLVEEEAVQARPHHSSDRIYSAAEEECHTGGKQGQCPQRDLAPSVSHFLFLYPSRLSQKVV